MAVLQFLRLLTDTINSKVLPSVIRSPRLLDLSVPNDYDILAWTELGTDGDTSNDYGNGYHY